MFVDNPSSPELASALNSHALGGDNMTDTILEITNVNFAAGPAYDSGLTNLNLTIKPGEMAIIVPQFHQRHQPLADLANGLIAPDSGQVLFGGKDWQAVGPDELAAMRDQIGRVFLQHPWLSNLDMDENITLAERYHTGGDKRKIYARAEDLAHELGFAELPTCRPAWLNRGQSQVAQLVRSLMGEKVLFILEYADEGVDGEVLQKFQKQLLARTGAAFLIFTTHPELWDHGSAMSRRVYSTNNGWLQSE